MVGPPCPRFRQVFVVILGHLGHYGHFWTFGNITKKLQEPPPKKKQERTWQFFSVFFYRPVRASHVLTLAPEAPERRPERGFPLASCLSGMTWACQESDKMGATSKYFRFFRMGIYDSFSPGFKGNLSPDTFVFPSGLKQMEDMCGPHRSERSWKEREDAARWYFNAT